MVQLTAEAEEFGALYGVSAGPGAELPVPQALVAKLKCPRREAEHSPHSSAQVKNVWTVLTFPNMTFCLIKYRTIFNRDLQTSYVQIQLVVLGVPIMTDKLPHIVDRKLQGKL